MISQLSINPLAILAFFSGFITIVISIISWKKGNLNGERYFSLLMLSCSIYSFAYSFELASLTLNSMEFFLKTEYFGAVFMGPFILMFSLKYTNSGRKFGTYYKVLTLIFPVLLLILVLTNQYHGLFYKSFSIGENEFGRVLHSEKGWVYWVHQAYSITLVITSTWLLVKMLLSVTDTYNKQIWVVLLGLFCPFFAYISYLFDLVPFDLDPIPLSFVGTGVFVYLGLFRFRLFNIVPIAYQTLFENISNGVLVSDSNGQIISCNQAAISLLGLLGEDNKFTVSNIFQNWPDLVLLLSNNQNTPETIEISQIRNGHNYWISASRSTIQNINADYLGNIILLNDITERKHKETELIYTKELLEKTSQIARVGGWEVDMISKNLYWSPIVKQIYGLPYNYVPEYKTSLDFFKEGDHRELIRNALEDAQKLAKPWSLDAKIVTTENKEVWVRTIGDAEFKDGVCIRLFGTLQDINEKKIFEEELIYARMQAENANIAKSEFLANMSHEIRTPLNSVIGFSDLMYKTELNDSQHLYMSSVLNSAKSLLNIINDILDFSKIEAGKLEIIIEKTSIYLLLDEVVAMFRHRTSEKNLELILYIHENVPEFIWVDAFRLRQVLVNLLGNAVKFTQAGEIELAVCLVNTQVSNDIKEIEFSVRDTGIGISKDKQNLIFEAFAQADSSTTRTYGGTGLGLTICNKILALMDGEIKLESKTGKGSRFYFTIKGKVEYSNEIEDAIEINNQSMLIVDENSKSLAILNSIISGTGIITETAHEITETLEKINNPGGFNTLLISLSVALQQDLKLLKVIRNEMRLSSDDLSIILMDPGIANVDIGKIMIEFKIHSIVFKPISKRNVFQAIHKLNKTTVNKIEREPEIKALTNKTSTILIVDDNQLNQLLSKSMILQLIPQAVIIEACDGESAVLMYEKYKPNLVFMDIQLPKISGYEATRLIRKQKSKTFTPIIALTAGIVKGERQRCLEAGMDDYLSKPITLELLEKMFHKWLKDNSKILSESQELVELLVSDKKHFNRELLMNRLGGNISTYQEIVEMIKNQAMKQIATRFEELLKIEIAEKNIRYHAHNLKGSSQSAGFEVLADLAEKLENLRPWDTNNATVLLNQIVDEIAIIQQEVEFDVL